MKLHEEKHERWWSRMFEIAYRDCIHEMTADEIRKKTEEFKFTWLNVELDDESVNKMFELMGDTKEIEKEMPEIYDVCTNHNLKECDWKCECEYNIIRDHMFLNLVKTVDLVRKANLRPGK